MRIAIWAFMLGSMLPTIRQIDWNALLPEGVGVEMPGGGAIRWPAGEMRLPGGWSAQGSDADGVAGSGGAATTAHFGRCGRGVSGDCVVDGDTFRLRGEKIRMADIDTPETHPPRCAREARLGEAATERLRHLLNQGPVTLEDYKRSHDRYGRRLAVVMRDGKSLGDRLIADGFARRYDGGQRRGWCGWV